MVQYRLANGNLFVIGKNGAAKFWHAIDKVLINSAQLSSRLILIKLTILNFLGAKELIHRLKEKFIGFRKFPSTVSI